MNLDPNCIRGLLLTVEEKCDFNNAWEYQRDSFESEYLSLIHILIKILNLGAKCYGNQA